MSIRDYNRSYRVRHDKKNIVVCIYQCGMGQSEHSHINQTLERLQRELQNQKRDGANIQLAFVYSDHMVDARDFQDVQTEMTYYMGSGSPAPLSHIWLMGVALLKKQEERDKAENINASYQLYCITDNTFERVECEKILSVMKRETIQIQPVLIRGNTSTGSSLERYIEENGSVHVYTDESFVCGH